jgi:hypothetical protein
MSELVDALIRESSYTAWKPTLDAKDEEIKVLTKAMWAQHDRNVELRREIAFLERALEQATESHRLEYDHATGFDRISLVLSSADSKVGVWWGEDKKPDLARWLQRTRNKWCLEYKEKSV